MISYFRYLYKLVWHVATACLCGKLRGSKMSRISRKPLWGWFKGVNSLVTLRVQPTRSVLWTTRPEEAPVRRSGSISWRSIH